VWARKLVTYNWGGGEEGVGLKKNNHIFVCGLGGGGKWVNYRGGGGGGGVGWRTYAENVRA